ncbi:MAG: HIT family protein [Candidatus Acidiferrales bacterium]
MTEPLNHRPGEPDKNCTFCRIVLGEPDAKIVFEDAVSMAFLDFRPLFPGHCLLISKAHYETLLDLPKDLIGPLFLNAQLLARTVMQVMKADGTFVAINNTISQSVPHFHIHIVPRQRGDGLRGFFWPRRRQSEEELFAVQQALSARLKQ